MLVLFSDVLRAPGRLVARLMLPVSMAAVVLMALSVQASAQDEAEFASLSGTRILDAFDTAAFGPADRPDPHLYRWPTDSQVTVRMTGDAPARFRQWTEAQIARLSALTGLRISITQGIGADVIIAFVPRFDEVLDGRYNDLLDRFVASDSRRDSLLSGYRAAGAVCAGQVNARGSHLAEAIVFIPIDRMAPAVRTARGPSINAGQRQPPCASDGAGSHLAAHALSPAHACGHHAQRRTDRCSLDPAGNAIRRLTPDAVSGTIISWAAPVVPRRQRSSA